MRPHSAVPLLTRRRLVTVLLVPFVGPPACLLVGGSPIARSMRPFLVIGALP